MANVNHSTLTDPYLHEPKGVAAASSGEVYVADGTGSGDWIASDNHISAHIPFDAATPAYSHSTTTSDTVLNPTFSIGSSKGFTGLSSPNARLQYNGTNTVYGLVTFFASVRQASGSDKDIEMSIYKNGTEIAGTRTIRTVSSGTWGVVAFNTITSLSSNDYLEIFIKGDTAHTTDFAGAKMAINCFPG